MPPDEKCAPCARRKQRKTLSVIMPVFNEENSVARIVERVQNVNLDALGLAKELIMVNDGSTDSSATIMRSLRDKYPNVTVLSHPCRAGKGAAVRTAVAQAKGDAIIIQDADLEYDPGDYVQCLQPIVSGAAQVVYGSRRLKHQEQHSSLLFYLGGMAVTVAFNILYGCRLTDEPTCYKAFKADLLKSIPFRGNGFEWEPEVTARLARLGVPIVEVPISYYPRGTREGKKLKWKDGIIAFWTLLKCRFGPL